MKLKDQRQHSNSYEGKQETRERIERDKREIRERQEMELGRARDY